ncbi:MULTISPECIES: LysR family transcriptional regulator [Yersinia]|uniref:LysR family transcriptional regulator n=1 Tax=Yersinia TaxID=629 RepID=UPI0011A8FE94|nr:MULTISPECIES: LysR family transcriptional regulator [Yersinia]MDA5543563.1 LysR family transcriptional regulator [Yersinia rochesterensis]MDN0106543.1 LysR family transcriptional regulator [Yersinia rochesterensis]MDR5017733.1 LysR family transcriptional regulator [Yersinia rochesterensis]UZM76989.1 LysR family transcriptional regulator [Yersinia sp. SCPM-O-B-9106 (C-191)]
MDNLSSLAVFVQVAETRSFVVAGRVLGVSASAVGKSIARLEARLGVRLFHRSTRSIALTSEGALFLERSRRILAEVEAAELEMSQLADKPRGKLRVSFPLVSTLLLPVLADFMLAYPDIALDLDFSDRIVDVVEEGFDAVIRTGELTDSRLSARKLGQSNVLLVASPAYLEQYGEPMHPSELANHICLHYRYPNSGKLETWPLPNEPDLQIPISMVCNNIETRMCFALRGLGIACLPDFSMGNTLAEGKLRTLLDGYMKRTVSLHVVWPSGRYITPKLRVFIDFLSERVFAGQ